LKSFSKL